ncbi:hypothetical protein BH23VER1_BH23VER1_31220 [soil metagenome]
MPFSGEYGFGAPILHTREINAQADKFQSRFPDTKPIKSVATASCYGKCSNSYRVIPTCVHITTSGVTEATQCNPNRPAKTVARPFPLTRENFGMTPSGGFRRQCRTCMRAHVKAYSDVNKSDVRRRSRLRQERVAASGGDGYSDSEVREIRRRLSDRCAYCDEALQGGGHLDHMTPVARGGKDETINITLCCESCNLAKHAKTVEEYLTWRNQRRLKVRHPRVV